MQVFKALRNKHIIYLSGHRCRFGIAFIRPHFPYNNDIVFINRGDKILGPAREQAAYRFKEIVILVIDCLGNYRNPPYIRIDAELLGTVVDIDEEQIVKQEVLDKIILIKALLICY